jgi:hypothetical protein
LFTVSPTQEQIFTVLTASLAAILPATVEICQAQDNRVPEPQSPDFIVMTPIRRDRLETNVDSSGDVFFTASIATSTMTVTALSIGTLTLGNWLFGTGVLSGTQILSQLTGVLGGIGTYSVSKAQTSVSQSMAAGIKQMLQPIQFLMQLDVHGPNSGDNAQAVTTVFRDEYGYDLFTAQCLALGLTLDAVVPIHADDPRSVPFENAENQYEHRWIIECLLQANETMTVPQQYAGALVTGLIEVDAVYPP